MAHINERRKLSPSYVKIMELLVELDQLTQTRPTMRREELESLMDGFHTLMTRLKELHPELGDYEPKVLSQILPIMTEPELTAVQKARGFRELD
jgi:hypothetical protein